MGKPLKSELEPQQNLRLFLRKKNKKKHRGLFKSLNYGHGLLNKYTLIVFCEAMAV